MNINGTNIACILNIADESSLKFYPLPHMPVIKDLVPDLLIFINNMNLLSRGSSMIQSLKENIIKSG